MKLKKLLLGLAVGLPILLAAPAVVQAKSHTQHLPKTHPAASKPHTPRHKPHQPRAHKPHTFVPKPHQPNHHKST
ncbi:MAG TPA: hypothetical protein VLE72_03910 [Candidatus Saccharimonadales bacterium]|nr:hypothetical protein [Candidatus Saccharimonadales bacterium]